VSALSALIEAELASPAPDAVVELAKVLADPARDAAILYYGSTLRTGDLTGILDFYRLTRRPHRRGLHGLVERVLWPEVSYHEVEVAGRTLRAKVATLPLSTFRKAAEGGPWTPRSGPVSSSPRSGCGPRAPGRSRRLLRPSRRPW
jgi:hypothetical protein